MTDSSLLYKVLVQPNRCLEQLNDAANCRSHIYIYIPMKTRTVSMIYRGKTRNIVSILTYLLLKSLPEKSY